jgi:N-acetyl-gamma-glutamyl-phosphate reductase
MTERDGVRVAIVGAGGYAGRELIRILSGHPCVEVSALFGSEKAANTPQHADKLHPTLMGVCELPVRAASAESILVSGAGAVFLATPHEASLDLVPKLMDARPGLVVLDLSASYRLPEASLYPVHYRFEHHHRAWLDRAVFGLAELNAEAIAKADLIAVPGCYPTSAILPLAPLVKAGAIDRTMPVIIDSVSGVSGAGRGATAKTHFCEVSLQAYNVLQHRHQPEIDLHSGLGLGGSVFTPHLAEFDRGILSTIHTTLASGWDAARIGEVFSAAYGGRRCVRLLGEQRWPSVAGVRMSNFCDIGWAVRVGSTSGPISSARPHLVIGSAIDNLVKGAAGQAVQCMNLRFGWDETLGLLPGARLGQCEAGGADR